MSNEEVYDKLIEKYGEEKIKMFTEMVADMYRLILIEMADGESRDDYEYDYHWWLEKL